MTDLSDGVRALVIGDHGPEAAGASAAAALGRPGIEPMAQSIGQLLVALSELVGVAAVTAEVRVGGLELAYQRLDRPQGSIELRWVDDPASPAAEPIPLVGSPEADPFADAGGWELGVSAVREGAYSEALSHFEREAEAAAEAGSDGRAAIAYRSASGAADKVGRYDLANHLLRQAGKHYLNAAEARETPPRAMRQAYEAAAKCFLQAGNLRLAETSIQRACSLDEALG